MKLHLTIATGLVGMVGMLPHVAHAETYSRTDTIVYQDDTANWVLGNVAQRQSSAIVAGRTYPNRVVEQTVYDANSLPWKIYKFGKLQQTLTHNPDGTIATVADGAGHVTTLSGWKRGVPQAISFPATPDQPAGATRSAQVNNSGMIDWVIDETGAKTCYWYDAMDRVNRINYPSEVQPGLCDTSMWAQTTITFAQGYPTAYGVPAGHWRQTTLTGNGRHVLVFDALWRPVVDQTLDLGNVPGTTTEVIKRYGVDGHLAFQSYPMNTGGQANYADTSLKGVHTTYDALDRVTQVDQDSELPNLLSVLSTRTVYGPGLKTAVTNPRQVSTITSYMAFDEPRYDWPVDIDAADGKAEEEDTDIARDGFGNPASIIRHNAAGTVTETRNYVYNGYGELCKTIEPETGSTLQHFDAAGNLDWSAAGLALPSITDCNDTNAAVPARKVARVYDARNRVLSLVFPDGLGNQSWSYLADGKPSQVTTYNSANNGTPVVNTYDYFDRGLLRSESVAQTGWYSWSIGYVYDANGHASSLTYPSGMKIDLAPNALGQATQAKDSSAGGVPYAWSAKYYANGGIASFSYGNAIRHSMTQNVRGLPERSRDASDSGVAVLDDSYDYDANGNVAAISDGLTSAERGNLPSGDRTMTYDGLDRLTDVVSPMYAATGAHYAYDALDNLTHVNVGGNSARNDYNCYDATWRLTNIMTGAGCTGATSHGLGYDTQGNLSNKDGTTYVFDFGNRLRSVSYAGAVVEAYRYDGLGRRVLSYSPTKGNILAQYSREGKLLFQMNQRNGVNTEYVYLGGSLVGRRERTVATNAYANRYEHTDALGSPVAVTTGSQAVLERNQYEPYGKAPSKDIPGYAGHVADVSTGLDYMQQRYYDPQVGTFLSVDPVGADPKSGGNFNRYKYASDNPYAFTDPDGRYDCKAGGHCDQMRRIEELIKKARKNATGNGKRVLDGIADFLGTEGDGNGVVIEDDTESESGHWLGLAKGGVLKVNFSLLNTVAKKLGQDGQDFMVASTVVHEGWHGWWEQLSRAAGTYVAGSRSFNTDNERRAGISEGVFAQGLKVDHPQGFWTREAGFNMQKIMEQAFDSVEQECRLGCGE